jgi:hypothetical protein
MANVVTEHSGREATTIIHTHQTAPTQFVEANGIRFAYRRFGKPGTIPLLLLEYFNSNMDGWEPDVTNSLAADHEVILFDNAGVGASAAKTPNIVAEMTEPCVAFCRALGLKQIQCSRQQRHRSDTDQRFHSGGASAKRSAHHVPGCEPRCIFAVCRELPGKCEAVSQWVGRAAAWIAVQATRVTSSSPLYTVAKIRRANVGC